jgi:hypothetical protein
MTDLQSKRNKSNYDTDILFESDRSYNLTVLKTFIKCVKSGPGCILLSIILVKLNAGIFLSCIYDYLHNAHPQVPNFFNLFMY